MIRVWTKISNLNCDCSEICMQIVLHSIRLLFILPMNLLQLIQSKWFSIFTNEWNFFLFFSLIDSFFELQWRQSIINWMENINKTVGDIQKKWKTITTVEMMNESTLIVYEPLKGADLNYSFVSNQQNIMLFIWGGKQKAVCQIISCSMNNISTR